MSEQRSIETVLEALDRDITAQRDCGNVYYQKTLTNIRAALEDLDNRTKRIHPFKGVAWLIECSYKGVAPDYYCGPAQWCSNPFHAYKFASREDAEAVSAGMTTIGDRRVADHSWV